MRIIGFSEDWPKLKQDVSIAFTTFRFTRRDRDWKIRELAQAVLKTRSPKRQNLGIVQIINKEPRVSRLWSPAQHVFTSPLLALIITEEEAIADGFASLAEMEVWLIRAHGRERVENEIINKLTLRWKKKKRIKQEGHDANSKIHVPG